MNRWNGCALVLFMWPCSTHAQADTSLHHSGTFGFYISPDLCQTWVDGPGVTYRPAPSLDTVPHFFESPAWGFSFGMLYERRLFKLLSVRGMSGLAFMNGDLRYRYSDGGKEERSVERTEVTLSLLLMPGAAGPKGNRGYATIGPSLGSDVSSSSSIQRFALRLDLGFGGEFRVSRFRMGLEARMSGLGKSLAVEPGIGPFATVEGVYWTTSSLRIVFKPAP
jgi:hypothetical protein